MIKIEEWFINIYNQCYTKENDKYLIFYYDVDYILKEKLYRIKGGKNHKNLMLIYF